MDYFKGIVHPRMKIMSSFTYPQVVPNLYECLCSAEHKGRYFEECLLQVCFGAPLTSIVGKKYYGCQWCPRTALFPILFRISSFVFSRTKTFIQVWNYLRVSKLRQHFHFWVNYPFNMSLKKAYVLATLFHAAIIINSYKSCIKVPQSPCLVCYIPY